MSAPERPARCFVFSCPHCGDPCATTKQDGVDIHAGATYRCSECNREVVFEVMSVDQYVAHCDNLKHEMEAERLRGLLRSVNSTNENLRERNRELVERLEDERNAR